MIVLVPIAVFALGGALVLWLLIAMGSRKVRNREVKKQLVRIQGARLGLLDKKRGLEAEIRRLESVKGGLTGVLSALELQRLGAERRITDAEHAAQDADRRVKLAEKAEEDAGWKIQDLERVILRKLEELSVAEKELAAAKREATEGIAAWTQTQQLKLENRLNELYRAEVVRLKNEMAEKIHAEIDKIQLYFSEFAASKKTFATNDISAFLNERLSRLKVSL